MNHPFGSILARSLAGTATCILASLSCAGLGACEETPDPVRSPVPFAAANDLSETRVRGGENGLEIVQWSAPCDSAHAAATIAARGKGGTLPQETIDRLRRNGLMVAEIPTDELPATLAELGGTLADIRNWHGQVAEWREILRTPVGPGVALYTGDTVVPVGGGSIRLAVRGWTVPMEDGGLFWLEMIPHAVTNESAAATAVASRDRLRGTPFADASLSVVLDKGWSLLVCPEPLPPATATGAGPDVDPPTTLGALLLPCEDLPPVPDAPFQRRTPVLVFVARLPDALIPLEPPPQGGS